MSCNCNFGCKNLVLVSTVTASATNIVLTIPAGEYYNGEKICLYIPRGLITAASDLPVVVQLVGSTVTNPVYLRSGNVMRGDQLTNNSIYPMKIATDTGALFYIGCRSLPVSAFARPRLLT